MKFHRFVFFIFLIFILGRDAIQPFIVDLPSKIYTESNIEVNAMFTFCSAVSIDPITHFFLHKLIFFMKKIKILSFSCISFRSSKEFILFYFKENHKAYDLEGLDRNFSVTLPFRERNLTHNSPVCLILGIFFTMETFIDDETNVSSANGH